ncbi:MAG: aquaporin [Gemmatimonadota bacterium]
MKKLLTEFIGTFFLVFTVCMCVLGGVPQAPLAIGCSLMIMVYMGGHISGGHFNPAVSLAVTLRGKLGWNEFGGYVIAQVVGAIVAALTAYLILGKSFALAPGDGISATGALLTELLFTFALALVVLNVATSKATSGNSYYGLAIGFTVVVGAIAGGGVSGGAFNPAVGLGPTIVHAMVGGGSFGNLWLYIVGPLLGGALAAVVFKIQDAD